jgi:flavin reductase (DIM6/NTAB) family NADH-FMN oxidoreductase RutF
MTRRAVADPPIFRRVLAHNPTGASVVTAMGLDGHPAGMVVGTFTSVSLDPPLVAFLPDKASTSWPRIQEAGSFCVNVLSAGQQAVSRQFARSGGNKFRGIDWARPPPGPRSSRAPSRGSTATSSRSSNRGTTTSSSAGCVISPP